MMSFKETVQADIKRVFLNENEFAEKHTVVYDGESFENIPVVLTKIKESKHAAVPAKGVEGIHKISAVVHISLSDLSGREPEQKQIISIDDGEAAGEPFYQKYKIITTDVKMGMVSLELEAFDE